MTPRKFSSKSKTASAPGEQTFHLLFANHPIPMWVYDLKTLAFLDVNQAAVEKYGYARDEFLALTIKDIRPAEDVARLLKDVKQKRSSLQHSGEWRHQLKNGEIIDVEITSHTLEFEGRKSVLVMAQDITERKRVEEALEESREKYRGLSEASFEAIFISEKGICLEQNQMAERMFGYSDLEALGRYGTEWISPEDRDLVMKNMISGYEEPYEVTALRKDGSTFPAIIRGKMMHYKGKTVRVTSLQDITKRKQAEDFLRESEEKYRRLFDHASLGIFQSTPEGKAISVNPAFARMFGYDSIEDALQGIKNVSTDAFVDPNRRTEIIHMMEENPDLRTFENVYRRKDGSSFIGNLNTMPVTDSDGRLIRIEGIIEDITERKRMEEALRESEQRLRSVLNSSPDVIYSIDLSTRKATFLNREEFYGYSKDELEIPGSILHRVHPDDLAVVKASWWRIRSMGDSDATEYRFQTKDGRWKWIQQRIATFVRNPDGSPQQLSVTLADITERKLVEDALRESEARFHLMFEKHDAIMLLIEPQTGLILDANQAATSFYGYTKSKLCEMSIDEINTLPPEQVAAERQKAVNEERNYFVFSHRLASGEERIVEVHSSPISFQEKQALFSIIHDITERKRVEKALHESEEKYRTVADFTYDLEAWRGPDGAYLYVSPSCERLTGYTTAEFLADPNLFEKITHPDDQAKIVEHRYAIAHHAREQDQSLDFRILTKGGEIRWVDHSCTAVYGKDGRWLGRRESNRDITKRKQTEEALRIAETKYRSIFENATIGVFQSTPQRRFLSVNPILARIFGYDSPEEMLANITSIDKQFYADPADRYKFERLMLEQGQVHEFISQNLRKDGSHIWIQIDARAVKGADGNILYYEGFITDINERKQIENELRESEEKYRRLVELSPDLISIHSEGIICFANQSGLRLVGASRPEEMVGKPTLEFVAPSQRAQIAERIQQALRDGIVLPPLDEKFVRLDGSEMDVSVTAVPTTWQGRPAMQVIARDITESKHAEEILRIAEANYRSIFENATVGIFQSTPQGRYLSVNPVMARIFGYDSAQEMITSITDIARQIYANPSDRQEFQRTLAEHGEIVGFVGRNRRKDGTLIWTQTNSRAEKDTQGNILYYEGFITDITERKQTEEELRYMKGGLEAANDELQTALAREKQLSHTDVLTGINNRRYLFELAEHEFEVATRYQRPLSVIMFDIDHFKKVNDLFGHMAGDQILERVAQVACAELRSADVIGRYGGEEFIILLPMTNSGQAYPLAERIRAGVAELRVPTTKGNASVTLSIGIVEISHATPAASVEDMFRRADEAMYAAKQAGRNRTEIGEK